MYQVEDSFPLLEDSPVALNEPRKIELAIEASGLPYTFFRPQVRPGRVTVVTVGGYRL
jgi:hypothetical protein